MNLGEKMAKYPTIPGAHCASCGNAWWFDRGALHECTTCGEQTAAPAPARIDHVALRNQQLERERILSDKRIRVLIGGLLRIQRRTTAAKMQRIAYDTIKEACDIRDSA